jgi:hypothetical protein
MSGNDLVRAWKDPDERGTAAHPAGNINLDDLSGGGEVHLTVITISPVRCQLETRIWPICPPPQSFSQLMCPCPD